VAPSAEYEQQPAVAMAPDGRFAVAFLQGPSGFALHVAVQRFAADGTPLTGELEATPDDVTSEAHPSIGMAADGRFVITWYKSTPFGTWASSPRACSPPTARRSPASSRRSPAR